MVGERLGIVEGDGALSFGGADDDWWVEGDC